MTSPWDDRSIWGNVSSAVKWFVVAGALLAGAVFMNMGTLMSAEWVTLVGTPGSPASDFIEMETDLRARQDRDRVVRLRINRATEVTGLTGVAYRSFDGTAHVDCRERRAHYISATYYDRPNFKGAPIVEKSFGHANQPPVRLRGFDDRYVREIVKLGCS